MPERRALLIGVSGFSELADESLPDLSFASQAVEELSQVLRDSFGYTVRTMTEPGLTTAQLSEAVRQAVVAAGENDILLVHLLTHGVAREDLLYALGSDEAIDETAEVGSWLAGVQYAPRRPIALFTLDLCNSGIVTRLRREADYDSGGRRSWVLAACEPDRGAFDGRFTRALTAVLREVADREPRINPADEFVPLEVIARAVRRAVVGMAAAEGGYPQYVVSSRLDMAAEAPPPPFFSNPSHGEVIRERVQPPPSRSLLALLDDADFAHFIEKATGSSVVVDLAEEVAACFSGRRRELHALSAWLSRDDESPLAVITGSPGAGKSALLGLLVCAAHHALRGPTTPIWSAAEVSPGQVHALCAIHASERRLTSVAAALGRQLGLSGDVDPDSLPVALSRLSGHRPVFVIDSLDEASDAGEVASWLINLASLKRADGSAAVRLLVGTRDYEESAPLRTLAEEAYDHLYDLDTVPARTLETDLFLYVASLLHATGEYQREHQTVGAFAGKLAETLVRHRRRGMGEFLIAGLFTRYFVDVFHRDEGPGAAERLAGTVPRTVPEVFELDLGRHSDMPWLRPVLTAAAHARGKGMPASVIRRVAAALAPGTPEPSAADIAAALRIGRSYLRQSADNEKVSIYGLCHEGLGEWLRQPDEAEAVCRGVLAGTGPAERRAWGAAEPYVLAHALDHAVDTAELLDDPGFLLYADRGQYLPMLSESTRRLVQGLNPADSILRRRAVMARAAVESGRPGMARRIAGMPGEQPLPWLPLWADCALEGIPPSAAVVPAALDALGNLRIWIHGPGSSSPLELRGISAFALAYLDGRPVIVTGTVQGAVQVMAGGGTMTTTLASHGAAVAALAIVEYEGELIVVSGGEDGVVRTRSLSTGQEICGLVHVHGSISALAAGGHAGAPVSACVTAEGTLWTWRVGPGQNPVPYQWRLSSPVRSVDATTLADGTVVVAGCDDGTARSLDCQTHTSLKVLGGHDGPVQAVAAAIAARRTTVVTGDQSGHIRKWDLRSGNPDGERLRVSRGPVAALALRATSNGLLCLAASKGRIGSTALWELDGRTKLTELGSSGANAVALSVDSSTAPSRQGQRRPSAVEIMTSPDGLTAAIIGDHDGAVRAVEFGSGAPMGAVEADGYPVRAIGALSLAGAPAAVIGSDRGIRIWPPFAGSEVVVRASERTHDVLKPAWRNRIMMDGHLLTVTPARDGVLAGAARRIGGLGEVTAIAVSHLDGRPVALAGNQAGMVMICDLHESRVIDELDVGGPVFAITAAADGRFAVGAGECVYAFERFTGL